jgi:GNAT superfamily N-acetyltransferase
MNRTDQAEIVITEERPDSPDASGLIQELESNLNSLRYPTESRHGYSIEKLIREGVAFFVTRYRGETAGCGGVQIFGVEYGEIKRMYVRPQYRQLGLGKAMIRHVKQYVLERSVNVLRLETGIYQTEAIGLYEWCGFKRRAPFGEYKEDPMSVYFELVLA